jgi:hypothetical protein
LKCGGKRSATPLFFALLRGYHGFSQNARSARPTAQLRRLALSECTLVACVPQIVAAAVTGGRSENPAAEDNGSYNAERTKEKRKPRWLDGVSPYQYVPAKKFHW